MLIFSRYHGKYIYRKSFYFRVFKKHIHSNVINFRPGKMIFFSKFSLAKILVNSNIPRKGQKFMTFCHFF